MPRLLIGNFDFENTLARDGQQTPVALRRIVAGLAPAWGAAAEDGDVLWTPQPIDEMFLDRLADAGLPRLSVVSPGDEIPSGLSLTPWGWTQEVIVWGQSVGAMVTAPQLPVVRQLNSRSFSFAQEQRHGVGLSGSARVESVSDLTAAIKPLVDQGLGWVVKAEFSNSSRERFVHRGKTPVDSIALKLWAQRRLVRGQALFVEPWVHRIDEIGVQLIVPQNGEPRVEGITGLLVDEAGNFQGCEFTPHLDSEPLWAESVHVALDVAHAAQEAGYFGPLGIDAMRYRTSDGEEFFRPLQDINARWTMGRLSLGLRRLLENPGKSAAGGDAGTFRVKPSFTFELRKGDAKGFWTPPESGDRDVRVR